MKPLFRLLLLLLLFLSPSVVHAQSGLLLTSQQGGTPAGTPPVTVDFPTGFAMNLGGGEYTSPDDGEVFLAESGVTVTSGSTYTSGAAFAGTLNDVVVQQQRWGVFSVAKTVPNGAYFITLGLAENYAPFTAVGQREQTYTINGVTVLDNYDVQSDVAQFTLVEKTFATTVADNALTIAAVNGTGPDEPSLGYVVITPDAGTAPPAISTLAAVAGDTTATLTFTKPRTATGVRIYRATASPVTTGSTDLGLHVSTWIDTGRTNGVTYYYAARAENAHGNSALSNEVSATPAGAATGYILYVEPDGSDSNDGSNDTTQALLTLAGARNRLRTLTTRTTDGTSTITGAWTGATVIFGAGTYFFASTTTFDERDSGTQTYPVVVRAAEGAVVKWTGAYQVPDGAWELASTWTGTSGSGETYASLYGRLPDATDQDTYMLDVAALGINTGGGIVISPDNFLRLIVGSTIRTMSRWPAGDDQVGASWVNLDSWTDTGFYLPATVTFSETAPQSWNLAGQNVYAYGSMCSAWVINWENVAAITNVSGNTRLSITNRLGMGYPIGGSLTHFAALRNALEALGTPGEYVWNSANLDIWYLPTDGLAPTGTSLTVTDKLIKLGADETPAQATNWVTFQNLIMEGTRDRLVEGHGGAGIVFNGCELRNFGGTKGALHLEDCTQSGLVDSSVHHGAIGAIQLHGGNKNTLTDAQNFITDTQVYQIGFDHQAAIRAAIELSEDTGSVADGSRDGCGITISGLNAHDIRDGVIGLSSARITIENSTFDRFCTIVGDAGGLSHGYRLTNRYGIIRNNTFSNMTRLAGMQHIAAGNLFALYIDTLAGWTIEDNTFTTCDQAMTIGVGKDNIIQRNKFTNCSFGHHQAPVVLYGRWFFAGGPNETVTEADLALVPLSSEPWATDFPALINYRVGGSKNAVLLYAENITFRDNMTTDGSNIATIGLGAQPETVSGYLVGFGGFAGTLSTRTSDTAGTITLATGHTVATGNTVSVEWKVASPVSYPERSSVTVGTVSGNSVPFTGGSGTVLPAQGTAVSVWLHTASWLNYPVGATGTPVTDGGTIPLGLNSRSTY